MKIKNNKMEEISELWEGTLSSQANQAWMDLQRLRTGAKKSTTSIYSHQNKQKNIKDKSYVSFILLIKR